MRNTAEHGCGRCRGCGEPSAARALDAWPVQAHHVGGFAPPFAVLLLRPGEQLENALRHRLPVTGAERAGGDGVDVLHRLQTVRQLRFAREPTLHGIAIGRGQFPIVAGREDLVIEFLLCVIHGFAGFPAGDTGLAGRQCSISVPRARASLPMTRPIGMSSIAAAAR